MQEDVKLSVLLVAPSPEIPGGISRWTKHILNHYKKCKDDCELYYLCSAYYRGGIKFNIVKRLWIGTFNYLNVLYLFRKRIAEKKYDVAHIATSASISLIKDIILIQIAKFYNVKSVVHFRFGRIPELMEKKNWEWKLLELVMDGANTVITIDECSYHSLISVGYKNVVNLPNPISDEILENIKRNSDLSTIPRSITFVGQMLKTKGIYELVEVCSLIPDIKLNMYGALPVGVKEELVLLAGKNSHEWLNVVGEIDYDLIVTKMLTTSIFILPTYTEGFPNVILESMACGCPIIASKVGAIPEMLAISSDTPCGVCIEPKNKKQLKESIECMLTRPDFAKILGDRARARVINEYSISSVWYKMLNIWKN